MVILLKMGNTTTFVQVSLEEIKAEVINCKKCDLFKIRTNPVIGEGSVSAKIMFIGEAPGANEDKTGRPFCGAAGKILDELLALIGLKREEIYIGNVLKCRPPDNREPKQEEIKACKPYLERQIEIIRPKVFCPMGNYATASILEKFGLKSEIQGISKNHGRIFETGTTFGAIKIIPLYHPAVAVYNINMKKILVQDFKTLQGFKN